MDGIIMKKNYNFGLINKNGEIKYAPSPLNVNGINIWTTDPKFYIEQGYYPIIYEAAPDQENIYTPYWYCDEINKICIKKWNKVE